MFKKKKIDFLAIGDIVIDAFIKLKDAHVHCKIDTEFCELCVRFGDKVPFESVEIVPAVGNSPNASVTASRLGLNSALYTNIGDDSYGKDCLKSLEKDGVITKFIKAHKGLPTNYHYVLWYGAERTILVKHTEFPYSFPKDMPEVGWVYLSSLAKNSLPFHKQISEFLKNNPETKLAFQPGTFQMEFGYDKLQEIYKRTEIFLCNKEEAQRILGSDEKDIKKLLEAVRNLGSKITVITDGPDGAYAYDGTDVWFIPMYPDIAPPVDRTGAGDAFSSTFTVAVALGKSTPEALIWSSINSMSVVQYVGAQKGLLSRQKLEEYVKTVPENYMAKRI
jgi:ribokinase